MRLEESELTRCLNWARRYAGRFSLTGHYLLNREDLEAEGRLLLAKMAYRIEVDTFGDFERLYVRSLKNRIISLARMARAQSRHAIEIDIADAIQLAGPERLEESYMRAKLSHAQEMLSPEAYRLMSEFLDPSHHTMGIALADWRRMRHLHQTGARRFGPRGLITLSAVSRALCLSGDQLQAALSEARTFLTGGGIDVHA